MRRTRDAVPFAGRFVKKSTSVALLGFIRSVLATVMLGKKARNDSAASEPDFAVFLIQICSGVHSSSSGVH